MERAGYKGLAVWRRSRRLAIEMYKLTARREFQKEWGLRDQMRRAAVSVPSNIAEDAARGFDRDSVRFFLYARGSLAELATQLDIAQAVGLSEPIPAQVWMAECEELGAMVSRLINERKKVLAEALGGRY